MRTSCHRAFTAALMIAGLMQASASICAPLLKPTPLEHYLIGDPNGATPDTVQPGLLLIGGGDHDPDAMRWFLQRSGHGHIVVLRASMSTDVADEIYREHHGAVSVETFVFHDRQPAEDPRVLDSLAHADGIFIAGGDQSRYVRFWKGTSIARLIDAHVAAGKPLAGTSAGLAILGEYLFAAMTPATVTSDSALKNPTGPDITIATDFLHFDVLKGFITDSHFDRRARLGRLLVFIAQSESMAARGSGAIDGLGIDETASLALLPDGAAHVFSSDPSIGATWVHSEPSESSTPFPLASRTFTVIKLDRDSSFNLRSRSVEHAREQRVVGIKDGRLDSR
jgi:beta-aspartyl-peptidase (threonine type)